jgi:hypothetical protein
MLLHVTVAVAVAPRQDGEGRRFDDLDAYIGGDDDLRREAHLRREEELARRAKELEDRLRQERWRQQEESSRQQAEQRRMEQKEVELREKEARERREKDRQRRRASRELHAKVCIGSRACRRCAWVAARFHEPCACFFCCICCCHCHTWHGVVVVVQLYAERVLLGNLKKKQEVDELARSRAIRMARRKGFCVDAPAVNSKGQTMYCICYRPDTGGYVECLGTSHVCHDLCVHVCVYVVVVVVGCGAAVGASSGASSHFSLTALRTCVCSRGCRRLQRLGASRVRRL